MSRESNEAGFSLVESLVALGVFALAGVGLVALQSHSVRTLAQVEQRALAELVAQNALAGALASLDLQTVGVSAARVDAAGRTWDVTRTVTPVQEAQALQIEISVVGEGAEGAWARVRGVAVRRAAAAP
jgi:general secretion pathway protein I